MIVTMRLLANQLVNAPGSSLHEMKLPAASAVEPQLAPMRLLSPQPNIRKTRASLFVLRLASACSFLKATRGIKTCQRSANDQYRLTSAGTPDKIPAPMKHPIYAAIAPHAPNHKANAIMKATAR